MIRTTSLLAAAALVTLPAVAHADKPANPGQHGRDNAAAKQQAAVERVAQAGAPTTSAQDAETTTPETEPTGSEPTTEPTAPAKPVKPAKVKRGKAFGLGKGRSVAFTLHGVGLTALPVADGALTGPLTLDPTAANKHARTLLGLTSAQVEEEGVTASFGAEGDEVAVRHVGLTADDALLPTDEVHVAGRVRRAPKSDAVTLDVTRITVVRPDVEDDTETEPDQA